jgi:hypothetical protein
MENKHEKQRIQEEYRQKAWDFVHTKPHQDWWMKTDKRHECYDHAWHAVRKCQDRNPFNDCQEAYQDWQSSPLFQYHKSNNSSNSSNV